MSADYESKACRPRIQIERIDVVDDVEMQSRQLDHLSFRESLCPGLAINIPANGSNRRDPFECGNDFRRAYISGMNDVFRAMKRRDRLRPQESVSI